MSFEGLMNDRVTLVKSDGTVVKEGIKAQVSPGKIITFETDMQVEPNDHFIRVLPNGLAEDYIVIDPGYHAGLSVIRASYQARVRRSDAPVASSQSVIHHITNHFHGPNSRVNINSVDNSTNTNVNISTLKLAGLLEEVKPHIQSLPEPQRTQVIAPVELLEAEVRSGRPDQSKVRAALTSIKTVVEGAAGNLVASGIGALVGNMLAGS
ncbi:hypothetical protein MOV66_10265 [Agrobacterium sp. SHOUNA12C]|nr:hypothetical protein [Agrobacterium sp. BETTINA12B]MCJ9757027.1 hypothetical protein [Agrobacterium sp. SHOUNA12C]